NYSECSDAAKRRTQQHAEGARPCYIEPLFTQPAQFVEADGCEGADQCEACHQWKEQRQHVIAEGEASQKNADERIDDREEDDMSRHGGEIGDAFRHCVRQIRKPDLADDRLGRALTRLSDRMEIGHSPASLNRSSNGREARVTQCVYIRRWSRRSRDL